MANFMPKITINFLAAAESFVSRSARGAVAVILRDAAAKTAALQLELKSAADVPTELTAANQAYLKQAFLGCSDGRVQRVFCCVLPSTATDLSNAYAWLATKRWSYLALPPDATTEMCTACQAWLSAQRSENNAIYKAVLPNTDANSERIVNFVTDGIKVGSSTFSAAQFCSRIAGLLAATPITRSVTYSELPEVEDVTRLTASAMDAAVTAGKLLAFHDGQRVRLGLGVNSLTAPDAGQTDDMKKILIMECRDMIEDDLRRLCAEQYIGKLKNTYDGRLTVLTAVKEYFTTLEAQTVVQSGWSAALDASAQRAYLEAASIDVSEMTDDEVLRCDHGTSMFIAVRAKILDAIENITIAVSAG